MTDAPGVVVAVVGPTATGKSDLGLALAEALGGEVVNADAMQLYRGMDIGTAKVLPAERRGIRHHLLDVLDPDEEASVAAYQRQARAAVADVAGRGRRAVVVGGSGLYVRALLDRMTMQPVDPAVRSALEADAERDGPGLLHDRLAAVDPGSAARIGRANTRRLVRALEVVTITGRPYASVLPDPVHAVPTVQLGLDCDRAALDRRIEERVDRMWTEGLVEEVRALADRPLGRTAARAVGYAQVLAVLQGDLTEAAARDAMVVGTRRLARKQMGWFGRDPRVHWLDARDPDLVERALGLVAAADAGGLVDPGTRRRALGS